MQQSSFGLMDLAGIEPASESLSLRASPITAVPLTFPHLCGEQLPHKVSSFIIRLPPQSFDGIVSRDHDAGIRRHRYDRADERLRPLRQLVCCLRLDLVSRCCAVGAADGFSDFKAPSKPVQTLEADLTRSQNLKAFVSLYL